MFKLQFPCDYFQQLPLTTFYSDILGTMTWPLQKNCHVSTIPVVGLYLSPCKEFAACQQSCNAWTHASVMHAS